MPLTVCPNCSSPMTEVARRSVYLDVCPSCRGVWLDGGELEKLLATVDAGASRAEDPRRYARPDDWRDQHRDDYDDRGYRRRPKRRRGGGVLDLFEELFD